MITGVCNSQASLYFINAIVQNTLESFDQDLQALNLHSAEVSCVRRFDCVNAHFIRVASEIDSNQFENCSLSSLTVLLRSGDAISM